MMVKPFEDAVVAMKPGEVAGPVQTQFGWHLIKLNETRDAAPPTLDDLRAEITDELQRKAVGRLRVQADGRARQSPGPTGLTPRLVRDQNLLGN